MSDSHQNDRFYVMQHARAQETIQRLQARNRELQRFAEYVAWGEWIDKDAEHGSLFGEVVSRRVALTLRDGARVLIRAGQEEAA